MCRPPTIIPAKANGTGDCACYFDIKVDGIGRCPAGWGPLAEQDLRNCVTVFGGSSSQMESDSYLLGLRCRSGATE